MSSIILIVCALVGGGGRGSEKWGRVGVVVAGGGDDDGPVCRHVGYILWHFMCSFLAWQFFIQNSKVKSLTFDVFLSYFSRFDRKTFVIYKSLQCRLSGISLFCNLTN